MNNLENGINKLIELRKKYIELKDEYTRLIITVKDKEQEILEKNVSIEQSDILTGKEEVVSKVEIEEKPTISKIEEKQEEQQVTTQEKIVLETQTDNQQSSIKQENKESSNIVQKSQTDEKRQKPEDTGWKTTIIGNRIDLINAGKTNNKANRPKDGYRNNSNSANGGQRPNFNGGYQQKNFNNKPDISKMMANTLNTANSIITDNSKVFDKNKKKATGNQAEEKKVVNKRALLRKGYIVDDYTVDYDDESDDSIKIRKNKKKQEKSNIQQTIEHAVVNQETLSIKTLAEKIGQTATAIVKKLFEIGQIVTINDEISFQEAELIALDFGTTLELKLDRTAEDIFNEATNVVYDEKDMVKRPPVVTIMGHVDHGKTSLLDYIRETHVVNTEAGGITQHIGAYTIKVKGEKITFLDTPGHEAFTTMRKRGAMVTDIAVIVVAADDGIMPQTIEAIAHAKQANVSIIVAVNKMDKQTANLEAILTQLSQHDLLPEAWGGDVIVCPVSAKTGMGIDKLLESILLVAELKDLKAPQNTNANGSIIEAKIDKGSGPIATVLIKSGTLKIGDYILAGTSVGRVRAMLNAQGKNIKVATPSDAVAILGFSDVPNAGDTLVVFDDEKTAKQVAQERIAKKRNDMEKANTARTLEDIFKNVPKDGDKSISVIIKGDVQGSVEAVKQSLEKIQIDDENGKITVKIVQASVGAINESDVLLADTSNSIIIAFNVRPDQKAKALAEKNNVEIRPYRVIYDMINDVEAALKGMLAPKFVEEVLGHAEVRDTFRITGVGTIAGTYVTDGKILRNKKVRLLRDNIVIYEGIISSLKRIKDDVKEVAQGYECGIGIKDYNDIKIGDVIEVFSINELKNE